MEISILDTKKTRGIIFFLFKMFNLNICYLNLSTT